MKNKLLLITFASLIFLFTIARASAYSYYGDGNYDAYSIQTQSNYGNYGGPNYGSSARFDSSSSSRYLSNGAYQQQYVFTYTTQNYPSYQMPMYPTGYRNNYNNYNNYPSYAQYYYPQYAPQSNYRYYVYRQPMMYGGYY